MAITETKPLKQLRELLHEQQEPFTLNSHLLERGYSRKSSNSESTCCFHGNSSMSLKRSVRCGLNTIKKPPHSRVLRAVLNQAISIKRRLRINGSNHNDEKINVSEKSRNDQQVPELDRFSSASSATVFNSFSESEVEEMSASSQNDILLATNTSQLLNLHNPQEVSADRKLQQQCIEESRQLSPASVLERIPSHGNFPIHSNKTEDSSTAEESATKTRVRLPVKFTEDCILSASLWEVLFYPPNEKPVCGEATETQEFVQSYFSPQYLKSKMVLQQTKQLLFDYVKEIVETQEREGKLQCHHQQFLGPEELGKVIGEKIKSWDKQSGNESNLIKLLNLDLPSSEQGWSNYKPDRRDKGLAVEGTVLDLLDSEQDWKEYEPQRRETGSEIGDIILEELVNDIVRNMISFSSPIPDVKLKLASKIN